MRAMWWIGLLGMACTAETAQLGPPPTLTLDVMPMGVGTSAMVTVEGMGAGAPVRIYASPRETGPVYCPPDLGGFCTDLPRPGVLIASGTADGSGAATLSIAVPNTPLRTAWLQALSYDGAPSVSVVERVDLFDCGDGVLDLPEDCDDGNLVDGDRCSNACASAEPILSDPGPELKLLFVGNSYTSRNTLHNIVNQLATELGVFTDVVTAARTSGGRQMPQHAAELASGGQLATLLASEDWNAVILQEQSQIPGFGFGNPRRRPSRTRSRRSTRRSPPRGPRRRCS
jgi:cysteine-rich repeat protein